MMSGDANHGGGGLQQRWVPQQEGTGQRLVLPGMILLPFLGWVCA